jgi:hypothetical protein
MLQRGLRATIRSNRSLGGGTRSTYCLSRTRYYVSPFHSPRVLRWGLDQQTNGFQKQADNKQTRARTVPSV